MSGSFEELWARLPHAEGRISAEEQERRYLESQRREFLEVMAAHHGKAGLSYLRAHTPYSHKRIRKIANAMTHLGLLHRIEHAHTVLYLITPDGYAELERMRQGKRPSAALTQRLKHVQEEQP